jgi:hypothetical protein
MTFGELMGSAELSASRAIWPLLEASGDVGPHQAKAMSRYNGKIPLLRSRTTALPCIGN